MHFLKLLTVLGLAALAAASPQDTQTTSEVSATSSATAVVVPQTSPPAPSSSVTICISSCAATDICCQAACVGVPCPDAAQVNATTECAMKCNQGNGSASETEEYAKCQSSCINSLFLSTGTPAPTGTGTTERPSSNSASASRSGSRDASSDSESSPTSPSEAAASASSTGNAATSLQIGASTAGILGLVMAALAL